VFATFKGSFNAESITSFLVGLTTGKEVTAPLPGGKLVVVPASAWDGKEAVVVEEEEFSLEDIMGEEVRRGRERGETRLAKAPLIVGIEVFSFTFSHLPPTLSCTQL